MSFNVPFFINRHVPAVLDIENRCFEFAWSREDFIRHMQQRNSNGFVAEKADDVLGFVMYEMHRNRIHVLNLAVHPDCRRQGVGSELIQRLRCRLSHERRSRIMVEVRESNLAAQMFFQSIGFRAISILRDFYDDTGEDGYLMQYRHRPAARELPRNRMQRLLHRE